MSSQHLKCYENHEEVVSGTQEELLEVLLQLEDKCYPWNPADLESEGFFRDLECDLFSDWSDEQEEIETRSEALFEQMHSQWAAFSVSVADTLEQSLSERFANFIPEAWLMAIASRAQQVVSINLSLADQLVMCVKPLLPSWTDEDLLVLARPLAYAMRGTAAPIRANWTELSQMEQVRLSLAVAHSALVQLQDDGEKLD
ncbi:MAG: hypothetical protein WBG73_08015 [Coleofasciculaceae cyanobacterium]